MKKKIAIIGASYLQLPLIFRAREMGLETHVFAWKTGDAAEIEADFFYPISIRDTNEILEKCNSIGVDGVCSIGSDLAMYTVNYVASQMDLIGNSVSCTKKTTNKVSMRKVFKENGDPSPWSIKVTSYKELSGMEITYPVIVKPTDRSGSRGVTKVEAPSELERAINNAIKQSFSGEAIVEKYIEGDEYSVEYISWEGEHSFIAVTKKYTTGAPHFVERAHLEPSDLSDDTIERIKTVVDHALNSLEVTYGASHSEVKISENGEISIIEIGARMGGDLIGSDLVFNSTGIDYVGAVLDVSMGRKPNLTRGVPQAAAVRYLIDHKDVQVLNSIEKERPEILKKKEIWSPLVGEIQDSSARKGCYVICSLNPEELIPYLPGNGRYEIC